MNKITILGSGTSTGVPILSCKCQVCQSNEVRNKRLRTSALIEAASGQKILVDASPDLRTQLLNSRVDEIHSVIITHDHADHTHGMDDLRPYTFGLKAPLPVYTHAQCAASLRQKFQYIFNRDSRPIIGGGIPMLGLHEVSDGNLKLGHETLELFSLPHGYTEAFGILHQKMAYVVDCKLIPENVLQRLSDAKLEILIIDCLRPEPHSTHLHLELTLEYIRAIQPGLAILTHMGHEWDYVKLIHEVHRRGAKNVHPAVDAQSFYYS